MQISTSYKKMFMNKIYTLLFTVVLFAGAKVNAQSSANYTAPPTASATNTNASLALDMNSNTVDMTTGTTQISSSSVDQGVGASAITIGFDFWLMGNRYTQFNVTTNGLVSLSSTSTSASGSSYVVSGGTVTTPIISAFAADLGTGTSGKTHYKIVGTAPSRTLVIEFSNMTLLWTNSYTNDGTYQVRLYESTGVVEFVYGTMSITSTGSASDATVGIGFATNTTTNNMAWITSATNTSSVTATFTDNPTYTTGPITNLNSAANGIRRFYRFTPPGSAGHATITALAAATALNFTTVTASSMNVNWTAASPITGIQKYAVYNSTDGGVTYNFVNTVTVGTNTLAVTGLTPSTTYSWKVVSVSEGGLNTGITGIQATTAAATYYWVGTATAEFNTLATWNTAADGLGSTRPSANSTDVLIIDGAGTVAGAAITGGTINASASVGILRITNNTAVTLTGVTSTRTITITGGVGDDFDIQSGSTLSLTGATAVAVVFSGTGLTGNIAGTLTFGGSGSNTVTTTGGTGTVVTVTSTGIVNLAVASTISLVGSTTTLVFANGSNCNASGSTSGAPSVPLATWNTTSNLTISGITTSLTAPTNNVQSFGNLIYNCPAASNTMSFFTTSTTAVIKGDLTIQATNTGKFRALTSGILTINGNLIVNGGTFEVASTSGIINTVGVILAGGTLDITSGSSTATLKVSGTFNQTTGVLTRTGSGTTNFLEFNGTSAQSVTLVAHANIVSYRVNNNSGINLSGTLSVNTGAGLRISSTAATPINGGTLTYTGTTTLTYDATGNQTPTNNEWPAASGPTNITINNTGTAGSANRVSLHAARTITGILSMTAGVFQLGNNDLTISSVGSISGAASNTNFIATNGTGQLLQAYSAAGSKTYPLGDVTGTDEASAVTVNYTALTGTSTVGVKVTDAQHPNDASPTNYLSRYYSFTQSGAGPGTYSLTLNYQAGDVLGTAASTKVNRWDGAVWAQVAATAPGATSVTLTGLDITSLNATADFTLRPATVTTYTWIGGTNAAYNAGASWSPTRTTLDATDILQFDGSNIDGASGTGNILATALPATETIGRLLLLNNANVNLQASAASSALTIGGAAGTDLDVPSGSTLTLSGTATNTIGLAYSGSGNVASIVGTLNLGNGAGTGAITYNCTNAVTTIDGTANSGTSTAAAAFSNGSTSLLIINGTYVHSQNGGAIPAATYSAISNVNVTGIVATMPSFPTSFAGNFLWNCASQTLNPATFSSTVTSIGGNFTLQSTGGSGTFQFGTSPTTTITGLFTVSGGTLNAAGGTLTLNGGLSVLGGTISGTGATTINVNGNLTQSGSSTITSSTATASVIVLNVTGIFNQSAGTISETSTGSIAINFIGSAVKAVTLSGTNTTGRINYNVNNGNGNGITLTGILNINTGATLTSSVGGTAVTGGTVAYAGTGSLIYISSNAAQTTGGEWPATSGPAVVTVNNSATAPANRLNLTASRTLSGALSLVLTNGVIMLGNFDLILDATGTMSISSPSATKMIAADATNGTGQFKKVIPSGASSFTFPIGDITGTVEYSPVTLNFTTNSVNRTLGLIVTDGALPSNGGAVDYLTRYWTFTDDQVGTYDYTSTYTYVAADVNGAEGSITPAYYNGVIWTGVAGSASSNVLTVSSLNQTSGTLGGNSFSGRAAPPVTYTWLSTAASTAWADGANWDVGTPPNAQNHNVIIGNAVSGNYPLLTTTVSIKDLTINDAAATLTINGGALTGFGVNTFTSGLLTLINAGTATFSGAITVPSGFVVTASNTSSLTGSGVNTVSAGGTLTLNNTSTFTSTGTFANAGTVNLNNTSNLIIAGSAFTNSGTFTAAVGSTIILSNATGYTIPSITYGNLSITGAGTAYALGSSTTVAGNFTITAGQFNVGISTSSYTLTVTGNYSQIGTSAFVVSNGTNNSILNVGGTFNLSSGTFAIINSSSATGGTVTVTGATTISATGFLILENISSTTGVAVFNANGDAIFSSTGATLIVDFGSGTVGGNAFNIKGNFTKTGTGGFQTLSSSAATGFVFNGTGTSATPQTFSYAGANSEYTSYVVNSGTYVKMFTALTIGAQSGPASVFSVNNGGTIDCSTLAPAFLGGATNGSFILSSGASLVTANTSGVVSLTTGSVSTSINTRSFNSAANYEFNGTSAITGTNFATTTMNNLTMSNTTGVTVNGAATINGIFLVTNTGIVNVNSGTTSLGASASMTINPLATFQVSTGGTATFGTRPVTIKSDGTGTGRIGTITGTFNTATNITMERFIKLRSPGTGAGTGDNGRAYRLLAPTVNTAGSMKFNWMNNENNTTVGSNINVNAPGYGTQITGAVGSPNFDVTASNAPSIYATANGLTPTYTAITTTSGTLNALTGYFIYIRGDRSMNMTLPLADNMPTSSTTLRTTGTLVTGTVPGTSFTNPLSSTDGALNLITNPYPSPIDWSVMKGDVTNTNIASSYTFWDPNVGTRGGFVSVTTGGIPSTFGGGATTSTANQFIQSGQAFFVQTSGGLPVINVKETYKAAGNNNTVFLIPPESFSTSLYFTEPNGYRRLTDGAVALFDNNYSAALDGDDAREINNWDENIAIAREGKHLAIEGRPVILSKDTIPLFMNNMKQQGYEFEFTPAMFSNTNLKAELIDNFLNTRTLLSVINATTVSFTVTADAASKATDRFMVVFGSFSGPLAIDAITIKANQKNQGVQVTWVSKTETDMVKYEVEKSTFGTNFTKVNTTSAIGNSSTPVSYNWFDANPSIGTNFYRVKAIDRAGNVKYSDIVKVTFGKGEPGIVVYPNPLEGRTFKIDMNNMAKGAYLLNLYNNMGQLVYTEQLQHDGSQATRTINLKTDIAQGAYQLQLSGGNGFKTTQSVIRN